jgi:hypothetical protein
VIFYKGRADVALSAFSAPNLRSFRVALCELTALSAVY